MKVSAPKEFNLTPNPEQEAAPLPTATLTPPKPFDETPAEWPGWYGAADKLLCVLITVAAFLMASSIARNSEFWRHIGSGRAIVQGKYLFGSDPFSYTTEGKPWVNNNWIFDLLQYCLFQADQSGAVAVVVKALAYAGAFAVLMLLRKRGDSLWPWAIVGGLAIMAAETASSLRASAYSMLIFAGVIVMLLKDRWLSNRRNAILFLLAVVLWANVDTMAFLAPLLVFAMLVGELLQPLILGKNDSDPPSRSRELAILLLLTIVTLFMNPSIIAGLVKDPSEVFAQMLPFEVAAKFNTGITSNPEFNRTWAISIIDREYISKESHGNSANGVCALVLFLLGGAMLLLDLRNLRISHIAIWVCFGILPILNYRWLPWFAIVAFPLVAIHWNGVSSRIKLSHRNDQKTRLTLLGSGVGRILCVGLAFFFVACAWPGWLHPKRSKDLATQQYVAWAVDHDEATAQTAIRLAEWRASGDIPDDYRGYNFRASFGDYCAWFAPGERVYYNSRYRLHRDAFDDYYAIFNAIPRKAEDRTVPVENRNIRSILDKSRIDYIVMAEPYNLTDSQALAFLNYYWSEPEEGAQRPRSYLWWEDGRSAILARDDPKRPEIRERLEYSVVHEAFRIDARIVESSKVDTALPPAGGWEYEFVYRSKMMSLEYDNSRLYYNLAKLNNDATRFSQWNRRLFASLSLAVGPTAAGFMPQMHTFDEEFAWSLLAMRSTRRTILNNPDNPIGYLQLGRVCQLPYLIFSETRESQIQQMTAFVRAHKRFHHSKNSLQLRDTVENDLQLIQLQLSYQPKPQIDLALQTIERLNERLTSLKDDDLPPPYAIVSTLSAYEGFANVLNAEEAELKRRNPNQRLVEVRAEELPVIKDIQKDFQKQASFNPNAAMLRRIVNELESSLTKIKSQLNERYSVGVRGGMSRIDLVEFAVRLGLFGKALESLNEIESWKAADYHSAGAPAEVSAAPFDVFLMQATLLFQTGNLEDAKQLLDAIEDKFSAEASKMAGDPRAPRWRQIHQQLRADEYRLSGNYRAAAEQLRDQIKSFQIKPEDVEKLKRRLPEMDAMNAPVLFALVAGAAIIPDLIPHIETRDRILRETDLYYRLGICHLHEGDIPAAKAAFEKTLTPYGIPLRSLGISSNAPMVNFSERFLGIINAVNAPKKK